MSRRPSAGEAAPSRGLPEWEYKSRLFVAQVTGVQAAKGTITVVPNGIGDQVEVTVPMFGLSLSKGSSAWFRYMPKVNDSLIVGYDSQNRLYVLGAVMGFDETSPKGLGYEAVSKLRESGAVGYRQFAELQQGEWDMRSSGGAYVHGSSQGTLTLAAGMSSVVINKRSDTVRIRGTALLASSSSALRLGTVRRKQLVTDAVEADVGLAPVLQPKEWAVRVETSFPSSSLDPAPGLLFEQTAGNVYPQGGLVPVGTELLAARTSAQGWPVRLYQAVYMPGPSLLPGRTLEVDAQGNTALEFGPSCTSVRFSGVAGGPASAATFRTSFLTTEISSVGVAGTVGTAITTSLGDTRIDGAQKVILGSTRAIQRVPMGDTLLGQLQAFAVSLGTAMSTLATAPGGGPVQAAAAIKACSDLAAAMGSKSALSLKVYLD